MIDLVRNARLFAHSRRIKVFDISGDNKMDRFKLMLVTSTESGYNFWMTGPDEDLVEFRLKFTAPGLRVEFENRFLDR